MKNASNHQFPLTQSAPMGMRSPVSNGAPAIRTPEYRRSMEKSARLRCLKDMHIGLFVDTEQGREALEIHAEMMREAHKEAGNA